MSGDGGDQIKLWREQRGISLRELARRCKISAPYLLDIERGRRVPSEAAIAKLADELEVSSELLAKLFASPKGKKALGDLEQSRPTKLASHSETKSVQTATALGTHSAGNIPQPDTIIQLIASGLVQLQQRMSHSQVIEAPYPQLLQRGFDLLVLSCLRSRRTPPAHIPDLLELCERPFSEWPLANIPADIHPRDALLCRQTPTYFCEEFARLERDVEAAVSEERFMEKAMQACAESPTTYTALRELLIRRPVLTEKESFEIRFNPPFNSIANLIEEAYQPAPGYYVYQGFYRCCPHCGGMLIRSSGLDFVCQEETCDSSPTRDEVQFRHIHESEGALYLIRPLRRYVSAPGRAEVWLRDQLQKLGKRKLQIEMWPALDAYDLRLIFTDGEVWAVDVKDWASPYLLAQNVKPFRRDPAWDKALFVFPDHRGKDRPNYLSSFRSRCDWLKESGTEVMFASEFLKMARSKVKR